VLLTDHTAESSCQLDENALRVADRGCDRLTSLDPRDEEEFRVCQDDVAADLEVLYVHIVWTLDDVRKKEEGQLRIPQRQSFRVLPFLDARTACIAQSSTICSSFHSTT
jgi:hypothetical protein